MGKKGFTLMELMMVVVIIGLLAAIAIPLYNGYVTRTRRADAITALQSVALAEEKARAESGSYVSEATLIGTYGLKPATGNNYTVSQYYNIVITNVSASTFTAYASPIGDQASDAVAPAINQDQLCGTWNSTYSRVDEDTELWNSLKK
jgi:type IV pilus assembly protein PilE